MKSDNILEAGMRTTSQSEDLIKKQKRLFKAREWKRKNRARVKQHRKDYYKKNKDRERQTNREWILNNLEKLKAIKKISDKKYREKNKLKIQRIRKTKKYRSLRNARERIKYHTIPRVLAEKRVRASFSQAIRIYGQGQKVVSINKLIGCSMEELVNVISSKFKPGMSWSNYGQWHIDHIKPCALFDLTKLEEQKQCFHYSNLQPLWAQENREKWKFYTQTV